MTVTHSVTPITNSRGPRHLRWVSSALSSMMQGNWEASSVLTAMSCSGCTDVTGFGLLGHLVEMAKASEVRSLTPQ